MKKWKFFQLFENGRKETTKTQLLFVSESWNLIKNDPGKKRTFFLSTLSLSLSLFNTHTHTHSLFLTNTRQLSLYLSHLSWHTHSHTFLSLTHTLSDKHTYFPSNSLSLILTHTHRITHTHFNSLSLSLWVCVIRAGVASELVVVRRIYSLLASFFAGEQKKASRVDWNPQ